MRQFVLGLGLLLSVGISIPNVFATEGATQTNRQDCSKFSTTAFAIKIEEQTEKLSPISSWKPTGITAKNLRSATIGKSILNTPFVRLRFTTEGARILGKITRNNLGKRLAFYVDRKLIVVPTISTPLRTTAVITVGDTKEAQELEAQINSILRCMKK